MMRYHTSSLQLHLLHILSFVLFLIAVFNASDKLRWRLCHATVIRVTHIHAASNQPLNHFLPNTIQENIYILHLGIYNRYYFGVSRTSCKTSIAISLKDRNLNIVNLDELTQGTVLY